MSSHPPPQGVNATVAPKHIAIIMDGNSRWAMREGVATASGHRAGVEAVRRVVEACSERGVQVLTLFAFSSENWGRPKSEVRALLALFARYLRGELEQLQQDNIRLRFIGRRDRFSSALQRLMAHAESATRNNSRATLVLAIDYGGRWDIAHAARELAQQVVEGKRSVESIDEGAVQGNLSLADLPAPDLCIRSGGDLRISNFLIWQFAYSELYFTDCLWPDFDADTIKSACAEYTRRERRFGVRALPTTGAP